MILGRNQPVRQYIQQLFANAVEKEVDKAINEPFIYENKKVRAQNEYREFVRNTKKTRR